MRLHLRTVTASISVRHARRDNYAGLYQNKTVDTAALPVQITLTHMLPALTHPVWSEDHSTRRAPGFSVHQLTLS